MENNKNSEIKIERRRLFSGYDGKFCKINPQLMTDNKDAFISWTMLLLSGSDVFYDNYISHSKDGGNSFSEPKKLTDFDRMEGNIRYHFSPTVMYHSKFHDKWFCLYAGLQYANDGKPIEIPNTGTSVSEPFMAFFDPDNADIMSEPVKIPFPYEYNQAVPFGQIMESEDGKMLISFYTILKNHTRIISSIVTAVYTFEGDSLKLLEAGSPILGDCVTVTPHQPGLFEPSVAKLGEKYYITLRNEENGRFAESEDGLTFSQPKHWIFDNGEQLLSRRTMQRWVRFKDALYLIYTRPDRLNGHVFRNRAPLYMTRFDEKRGCLIRAEEIILVPELGARLGNFSVTDISPNEAILTVAEWMQPEGCEKYGSDNSIWLVKIRKD